MLGYDPVGRHFLVNDAPVCLSAEEREWVHSAQWWHAIPFSADCRAPGVCDPTSFISHYHLDKVDFQGKHVLDIGCWDGFQSFYAESQGAERVVGIDDLAERTMDASPRDFAKMKLNSQVEFYNCNIYDLHPDTFGEFDIVMMFGVLYHLKHPMLGLEKASPR